MSSVLKGRIRTAKGRRVAKSVAGELSMVLRELHRSKLARSAL